MKKIAVISLTERGRALSARIAEALPDFENRRFCFAKHTDEHAESFDDLSALTARIFPEYDALIFVCACGIAVRMTAPHLRDKQTDPAVIVTDDRGRYVIPLLSGHLGGANARRTSVRKRSSRLQRIPAGSFRRTALRRPTTC